MYEVEFTDEFRNWYEALSAAAQKSCVYSVELLMHEGPKLSRPHADTIKGSRYSNLKELRVQHAGGAYRIFFAMDPRRVALLLLGGIKTDSRFYKDFLPKAEALYANHLRILREEEKNRGT